MTTRRDDAGFDKGWDTRAVLVDGRWVDRTPRRPEVEPQVRREVALMPWLAPQLPLPVPVPRVLSERPLTVRHELIVGEVCPGRSPAQGTVVAHFLRALHAVDTDEAVRNGAPDSAATYAAAQGVRHEMRRRVLPLLPPHVAGAGAALLDRMSVPPPTARLIHGDLGPEHIRVAAGEVTGVIDWGDCAVGDPALDLAWTVFGSDPEFGSAVRTTYEPDDITLARARDWHQLGPWHEVHYGLLVDDPDFVESGLAGTVARLEDFAGGNR